MRQRLTAPALLLLVLSGPAQSTLCHVASNNSVFDDLTSMGGPNLLFAIKTKAANLLVVTRAEVWTGEQTGSNSIALWSHDAVQNRPLQSLGSGSWSMSWVNGWQGASFATPIVVPASTDFWIVWAPINAAQATLEVRSSPLAQVYRASFDGGQSWNGPYQSELWKFRLFCAGRPGQFETFGAGCAGSNRSVPALGGDGVPTLGQPFTLLLGRALASSTAWFVLGASDAAWGGLTLPFDLAPFGAACRVLCSQDLVLQVAVDTAGRCSLQLPIPNVPAALGGRFFAQAWVVDAAANGLKLVASNGGRATVGD